MMGRRRALKAAWVPPGEAVTVGDYLIPGGMVYVLPSPAATAGRLSSEPSLIHPHLPLAPVAGRLGGSFSSWMTYRDLTPPLRAGYLRWLAGGRSAPDIPQVYLYLFFCGIERRILIDLRNAPGDRPELPLLLGELVRLMTVYRRSAGFVESASYLAVLGHLFAGGVSAEALEPLLAAAGSRNAAAAEIGAALLARDGRPLSAPWAFSLWATWDQAYRAAPFFNCPREVRDLFLLRFSEAFPAGIRLPRRQEMLGFSYLPQNPSLRAEVSLRLAGLHGVRRTRDQMEKLQQVADRVFSELAPYSRWVRKSGNPSSPAALVWLPAELARGWESEESRRLVRWIETTLAGEEAAAISREDVASHWVTSAKQLTARDLADFATFLGRSGYGIEPDPRFSGSVAPRGFFLFRLADPEAGWTWTPSPGWTVAELILRLAVAVAAAEGPPDPRQEERLLAHVLEAAHLDPAERERLQVRLAWLLVEPQGLAGCKERCAALTEPQRQAVVHFLLLVAGADGQVSPGEIRQLKKIYRLLGREPEALYADVHALAAGSPLPVIGKTGGTRPRRLALDLAQVETKLAETEQVSTLLGEIFQEDEPAAPARRAPDGLDATHAALLRELAARSTWPREDFDRRATALGLLPDGALEILNEAAFARCGAPLLEGDETLDVDPEILEELLA